MRTSIVPWVGLSLFFLGSVLAPGINAQQARSLSREDVRMVDVPGEQVIVLHGGEDGQAKLPSLAISPAYAYVAFDVRLNGSTRAHLCRLARGGEGRDVREEVISPEDAMSLAPSVAVGEDGTVWLAWASYRDNMWTINGCRITDMRPSPVMEISGPGGFNSQVKVVSKGGTTWFAWILWEDGVYRIMANTIDGELGRPQAIYEGADPLGRVDLQVVSEDRLVFAWDEYVDGRYAIRMREKTRDGLQPVQDVSGTAPSNNYGPSLAAGSDGILAVWNRVPLGGTECRPAARMYPGTLYEEGLDSPKHNETWRVNCFGDGEGNTWILWLNRLGHASTRMYARLIGSGGLSETCRIRFERQERIFMDYAECACDGNLVLAWDSHGAVALCEIELPTLKAGKPESLEGERAEIPEDGYGGGTRETIAYTTTCDGDSVSVYFGDYHNHTSVSDGRAYPDMSMLFARDTRRLDFVCITDHDGPLMPSEFAWNNTVADMLTREGDFVCLHGFEVSQDWAENDFGHWNMLFPGPSTIVRYEEGMTPDDLYRIAREYGAVVIPHHVAKTFAPHSWEYHDPVTEPVVEMCSLHGVFETGEGFEDDPSMVAGRFVEDGLARGYKLGFVGASDFHNCFRSLTLERGLTGVYAGSLAPEEIFEAIKHRRTFATTGCRVVVDFRCNGKFMGEELETSGGIRFSGYAESPDSIASIEIVSGGDTVFETRVLDTSASVDWRTAAPDSETYYYLRVRTPAGGLAWSSPIWISPGR